MKWNFSKDTVYVSAGAWGIGRAAVTLFARSGARVVFGDVDVLHGVELANLLTREGCEVRFLELNFANTDAWIKMHEIEPAWIPSIMISNAGIPAPGPIENFDIDKYDHVQAVNQRAALLGARTLVPLMRRRGGGSIVFVGSIMASSIFENSVVYVATKTALEGTTKALAVDLGPENIRVNCVAPGFTNTGITSKQRERVPPELWTAFANEFRNDLRKDFARQQPLSVAIDADDIAQAVAFLCSPAARCITGITLPVDGALSLKAASLPETRGLMDVWNERMEYWFAENASDIKAVEEVSA